MSGFDGATSGIDFGSRLISGVYGLHRQEEDRQRKDAEGQRESMLNILTAAANSGNVNNEDMSTLIKTIFHTASAKPDKKAIEALGQHVEALFSDPSVTRKGAGTFGPPQKGGGVTANSISPTGEQVPVTTPTFEVPGVPMPTTTQGPAIRLMTPEERTTHAVRAKVAEQEALLPGQLRLLGAKTEEDLRRIRLRTEGQLQAIQDRGDSKAQANFNQRYYANKQAGMGDDAAKSEAATFVNGLLDAGVNVKKTQAEVNTARKTLLGAQAEAIPKRLADMEAKTLQLKLRTHDYVRRMEALNTGKAADAKSNVSLFNAMNRELFPELTALNRMITKLETDPDVVQEDEEVQQNIADLKARVKEIRETLGTSRDRYFPGKQLPDEFQGVEGGAGIPAVPGASKAPKLKSDPLNLFNP